MNQECLWRIKDAEELLKSRITQVQVDQQMKSLRAELFTKLGQDYSSTNTYVKTELDRTKL